MKEIKAIIQPHMLSKVMDALHNCEHFPGATISDCQGQSRGRGKGGHYEPTAESIFFAKKVKLEIVCSDNVCDQLVGVVQKAAHTGNPGDGLIVVADLTRVARIRTAQEQDEAV
ncbi:P-II family nitrogen regulator [Fontivita pretiosa]|uniref:P-II family nitrogen regulator n=1 Tax=Fontivita pretiosa TaxID=2989684 RepID=UPI003D17AA73